MRFIYSPGFHEVLEVFQEERDKKQKNIFKYLN